MYAELIPANRLMAERRWDEAAKAYEESIGLIERNSGRFSGPHQGMARLLLDADPYKALPFAHKALELEPSFMK